MFDTHASFDVDCEVRTVCLKPLNKEIIKSLMYDLELNNASGQMNTGSVHHAK